jgi:hypothetical protein
MSATISIYSHQSENSRNSAHLYDAPELTLAFNTTHTSTDNRIRKNPMTKFFTKTIPDKETKLPLMDSPPTPPFTETTHTDTTNNSTDALEATIAAHQSQTTFAFCHLATKNYAAIDIRHNKTTQFLFPHQQFSNSKTAASTSCNPSYCLPISEKAHKLHPIIESNNCRISSTACNASRLIQASDAIRIPNTFPL